MVTCALLTIPCCHLPCFQEPRHTSTTPPSARWFTGARGGFCGPRLQRFTRLGISMTGERLLSITCPLSHQNFALLHLVRETRASSGPFANVCGYRYLSEYPKLSGADRPFECVQGPGEVFFVPSLWGHGVLYLEDTIGMASLFHS